MLDYKVDDKVIPISGGSIAILIDCWDPMDLQNIEPENYNLCQSLTKNILRRVEQIPDLAAVIIATYNTTEPVDSNLLNTNRYYSSSKEIFCDCQPIPFIREHYNFANTKYSESTRLKTDPLILNHIWNCQQFAMFDVWQVEHYINHIVPHVKNIFYFGRAWNICVQQRPIGVENMKKLITHKYLHQVRLFGFNDGLLANENGKFNWPDLENDPLCRSVNKSLFEINIS